MLKHGWGVAHIFIAFRLVEGEGASGFCCILVVGGVVLALLYPAVLASLCMLSPSWSWCPLKAETHYLFLDAILSRDYGSSARGEVLSLELCNFPKQELVIPVSLCVAKCPQLSYPRQ